MKLTLDLASPLRAFSAAGRAFVGAFRNDTTPVDSVPPAGTAATPFGTGPRYGTNVPFSIRLMNDMRPQERAIVMRESAFVTNRLGMGRALVENTTNFALGEGLISMSDTGDQRFDDDCDRFLDTIFEDKNFDLSGEHDFYSQQNVVCMAMMIKGDNGALKVLNRRAKSGTIEGGPKIQLFPSESISNGRTNASTLVGSRWREGVEYNDYRRKINFRLYDYDAPIFQMGNPGKFLGEFSERDFILTGDPKRINQGRYWPWLHHATGTLLRIMDLTDLETKVAYLNARWGAYIKTPTGELPAGFENEIAKKRSSKTTEDKDGNKVTQATTRTYGNFLDGAAMPVLAEGEEIGFYKNERNSISFAEFVDWLFNDAAVGFGTPRDFIAPIAGKTGPDTRRTLDQADWFFRKVARIMASNYIEPVRRWVIDYGLITGKINGGHLPKTGVSPYARRVRGPKKVTIDDRYYHKTCMERIRAGLMTEEDYFASLGLDAKTERRARVKEVKDWEDLCTTEEVDYNRVIRPQPGELQQQSQTQDPPTNRGRSRLLH